MTGVDGRSPADRMPPARQLDEIAGQVDGDGHAAQEVMVPSDAFGRFRRYVCGTPEIRVLFADVVEQLSRLVTPTGCPQINSVEHLLELIGEAVGGVPRYDDSELAGLPLNAVLNCAMSTRAGFAVFSDTEVNRHLADVLNEWARFLGSRDSLDGLREGGWLSARALRAMSDPGVGFEELFECDPQDEHYGFESWNHFFTRGFRDAAEHRPVAGDDTVVVSACEAVPYRVSRAVRLWDNFCVKGQPYSLAHLLDTARKDREEPAAERYVGGTVYQGYLKSLDYHQWHSPVAGEVVACRRIAGSYFSQAPSMLGDPMAPQQSQGYLAHVATRALIFIKAVNEEIGTLCFVGIGMAEVSSCVLAVEPGDRVEKGQKLGEFQYGGSSHCLIFEPGVALTFVPEVEQIDPIAPVKILVNAELATVGRELPVTR